MGHILNDQTCWFDQRYSFGIFARVINYGSIPNGNDLIAATGHQINRTWKPQSGGEISRKRLGRLVLAESRRAPGGVTMANDLALGAGSLPRQNIPANSVLAGVPAHPIRTIAPTPAKIWRLAT